MCPMQQMSVIIGRVEFLQIICKINEIYVMIKVVFGFREYFCKFVALTRYIYTHLLLMNDTKGQFEHIIGICRDLFVKKLHDYGASWRIMRPESITDQIFIKAKRIRNLEIKKVSQVGEGVYPEFVGIVNYGIVGLIQLDMGFASTVDISIDQAVELYDKFMDKTKELMLKKNADYDEAWRDMRINSYTDLILTKIQRTKQIEDHHGTTIVSEGVDANYMDMVNYSIFALIKLEYGECNDAK